MDIIKELQKKEFLLIILSQYEDIDLGWKDEMKIEEDNLLISYNLAEAISNNVIIETILEELNHSNFKVVLKEYKNI